MLSARCTSPLFNDLVHNFTSTANFSFNLNPDIDLCFEAYYCTQRPKSGMVVLGTRWKSKNSEAYAHANPMSKIVSELQSSLIKSKARGLLLSSSVLLELGLEQADLLNQACFGTCIVAAGSDKRHYELSLEEAFYMCHCLECIGIVWEGKCVTSDNELWQLMKSRKTLFPIFYKTYSHLRAKNWVVRSEIKYGVDFVAYHHHPRLVHSAYAVMVSAGDDDINTRLKEWPSVHATVRLEDGVAKSLLVLCVSKGSYDGNLYSHLEHYTVNELIIGRWNPEHCLDGQIPDNTGIGKSCESIYHAGCSPHYHFKKFSQQQELPLPSPSSVSVNLNSRWKGKSSKALALANPLSELIVQLQSSLAQSKACGFLAGSAVLIMVGLEQADLLNRACFGCPILTASEGTHWYELSLEEAFYLCHALTCIEIVREDRCLKNSDEVWELIKSKRKLFPVYYKAYSHLRAKNWVVRSGIQYGVDFVAYGHHPSLVHSEYAVIVSEFNGDRDTRLMVWSDVHATVRLEGGVAKTLLLLHIKNNGYDEVTCSCLKQYTVMEQIITRWSSEQSREDKKSIEGGN